MWLRGSPIIAASQAPRFGLPGLTVRGLASPNRGATEISVRRLTLEPGTPGVPHSLTREEVFVATSGRATATVNGERHPLTKGDALLVPAGTMFSLANDAEEPFEAVVAFPVRGQAVTDEGTFTPPWAQ
ncbi:cupin domain-containing protein [Streptomyces sp. HPF1205]|uniref:cupin domain-containing protein n=1 Tax=Streptomyces sp. HPF1205 TaxID=2873262 RepID=UPI001CECBC8B|nr:cupin domain-containing protein [Streptomyces sp. HPF1205]